MNTDDKSPNASVPPNTIAGYVLEGIRAGILDGRFPSGSRLNQEKLAKEFGVSIIPVRESLHQLQAEGFVILMPRRGAYVVELSSTALREMSQIREALEDLALRLAMPRLDDAFLDQLKELNRSLRRVKAADVAQWEALNREWHFRLYGESRSSVLIELIRTLWDRCSLYRHLYLRRSGHRTISIQDHEQIIEACRTRDVEAATRTLRDHIRSASEEVCSTISALEAKREQTREALASEDSKQRPFKEMSATP